MMNDSSSLPLPSTVPSLSTTTDTTSTANDRFCYTFSDARRIIDLNNIGATLLAKASDASSPSGSTEEALSYLVQALKVSRSCMVNRRTEGERTRKRQKVEENQRHCYQELELPLDIDRLMAESDRHLRDPHDQDDEDSSSSSSSSESSISHREGLVGCGLEDSQSPNNDEDDGDFVYDRPIFVKDFYARHCGLQRSETALSSIILFNLALANHLMAIRTIRTVAREGDKGSEEKARERLRKTLELYKLTLQLQTIGSSTQIGELLLLSCLNNVGSAYGLLGDDRSEECANEKLLATLMYLTTTSSSDDEKPMTTQGTCCKHRYEPFFRNVFKKETSNKAPAA